MMRFNHGLHPTNKAVLDINGHTALYGIIGHPVAHSLSPLFQNKFIEMTKRNAAYLPFDAAPESLASVLHGLHPLHIHGLNITVPHKEAAMVLSVPDRDARTIGAVNTLKWQSNGWTSTNTDWRGFVAVLQGLQADVTGGPILLFGAGGTAKAICHALVHLNAKEIWICNRNAERAQSLHKSLKTSYPSLLVRVLNWQNAHAIEHDILNCSVVINATSIGLNPTDTFPFTLSGHGFAIDVVYQPNGSTAFLRATYAGHYTTTDGLAMLVGQGVAAFSFWHHDAIMQGNCITPDIKLTLQWLESKLERKSIAFPGWEGIS